MMMNKFYENKIVLAILSLILALVLFVFVKTERSSRSPLELFQNVSEVTTETVSNVPVNIEGDVEQYYVTGLPESVTVKLSGPSNIIDQILESKDFQVVTEDLTDFEEGNHYIQLHVKDASDSVKYEISPSSVNITLETLHKETFPVSVNITNPDSVASGYEMTQNTTNPSEVTLSGSKAAIDSISDVHVDLKIPDGLKEDYTQEATVIAEDGDGTILNVNADPKQINATVEVGKTGRSVPITIETVNERDDMTYDVENIGPNEATLIGDDSNGNIDQVTGTVDVSNITEETVVSVPLDVPNRVKSLNPDSVDVRVTPHQNASDNNTNENSSASESSESAMESNQSSETNASTEDSQSSSESSNNSSTSQSSTSESEETPTEADAGEAPDNSEVNPTGRPMNSQSGSHHSSFWEILASPFHTVANFFNHI